MKSHLFQPPIFFFFLFFFLFFQCLMLSDALLSPSPIYDRWVIEMQKPRCIRLLQIDSLCCIFLQIKMAMSDFRRKKLLYVFSTFFGKRTFG